MVSKASALTGHSAPTARPSASFSASASAPVLLCLSGTGLDGVTISLLMCVALAGAGRCCCCWWPAPGGGSPELEWVVSVRVGHLRDPVYLRTRAGRAAAGIASMLGSGGMSRRRCSTEEEEKGEAAGTAQAAPSARPPPTARG